jgi:hypothetical protein
MKIVKLEFVILGYLDLFQNNLKAKEVVIHKESEMQ